MVSRTKLPTNTRLLFSLQTRIDFTPYTGMGCGLLLSSQRYAHTELEKMGKCCGHDHGHGHSHSH